MSDQGFREIQLGGKQLVFLFMLSVVLAVAIFLLGISVGRGVRTPSLAGASTVVDVASPTDAKPDVMPPPTELTAADQSYHERLQAGAAGSATSASPAASVADPMKAAEPPPPVDEAPASSPKTIAAPPVAALATKSLPPAPKAAPKADAPKSGGWIVNAGAYGSRSNAEKLVSRLKSRGYTVVMAAPGGGSPLYRVRVGPFDQRAEADRAAQRIQRDEGFKPSVAHQ